jgi:hypothetical protein
LVFTDSIIAGIATSTHFQIPQSFAFAILSSYNQPTLTPDV